MKLKHWMLLAFALFSGVAAEGILAQAPPPSPQETAPPVVPAGDATPKAETKKPQPRKKAAAPSKDAKANKAASENMAAPISPGPAVAREKNVNIRGQAAINSEIVTRLKRGDLVTVLEEITLKKPKADEPAKWAKVALPADSVVWVNTQFINPDSKTVIPRRLNVRSGPGENYSILGRIDRGASVKEVEIKGDWMKIEAPTNSYAFIAAHLLSTDPADLGPALAKANPPPPAVVPPPPTETAVVTPLPVPATAEPLTSPPVTNPPLVVTAPPPPPAEAEAITPPPPPAEEEPLPKRIVTREGFVKGSASIQAPSYFVLRSLDNNKTINYLFAPSTNVTLRGYHLQRVLVTGEELLDERWPNTPVINVESIESVP